MEKIGNAMMMGDRIYAGIDKDDICEVKNAVVVSFDDIEALAMALRERKIEFEMFKPAGSGNQ